MSSDRNLLFGMLALQMDLVSRDQLLDAMHAWVLRKHLTLSQILRERGALADEAARMIDGLVDYHVNRHGDVQKSLASLRVDPQARHDLEQIVDPDLQTSLAGLRTPPKRETIWPGTPTPLAKPFPVDADLRYRKLRAHARGGLGEVFVALDEELGREVALKEIQERFADDADSRSRFVREAEVTGSLEHPGVVPVYGLQRQEDGRPLYAMRFIRGEPMREAIRRFHQAEQDPRRDPTERSLALRDLLTRFVAVCNAVGFAHARGVVHRDIKPHNVMLGEFGETLVVDWGLARVLGQPEGALTTPHNPLQLTDDGGTPTRQGQAVGTPAYMPPEQARGEHDRVDERTDVWALGALLYSILAGRPPYQGNAQQALEVAARCDFPPPHQVRPGVPKALAAVCGKAMAAEPQERYPTARTLAADVERWLADEPVSAYREPARERLRRWARRRRTLVTSLAVLLCASVVGLSLGLWAVGLEQRKTLAALETAQANLERAEEAEAEARGNYSQAQANLKLAREAVDECFNVAKEHPLFQKPGLNEARKLLLEKTLPFYRNFRQSRPGDRALQREEAEQWFRVGFIETTLKRLTAARKAFEQARASYEELVKGHPDLPEYQNALARTHNNLGNLLKELGKLEEAAREHELARSLEQNLAKGHPEVPKHLSDLASTHANLGVLQKDRGKREEAAREFEQSRLLLQKLTKDHPDVPEYQNRLARTHHNLGNLLKAMGRREEAVKGYDQACSLLQKLAKGHPDVPEYQSDLAATHISLGVLLADLGKPEEAVKEYGQACSLLQKLAKGHPDVPEYVNYLAATHTNLGVLLADLGKPEEAVKEYEQARSLRLDLSKVHLDVPEYQYGLARTHNNLGNLLKVLGKLEEAAREYEQARSLLQKLAEGQPNVSEYQSVLASTHYNLGALQRDWGKREEAAREFEQSRLLLQKLAKAHPDVPEYQNNLARTHNNLGILLKDLGRREEAAKELEQARKLQQKQAKGHPDVTQYQIALAGTLVNLSNLYHMTGRAVESLPLLTEAIPLLEAASRREPRNPTYRLFHRNAHLSRGKTLTQLGRHHDADADWDRAIDLTSLPSRAVIRLERATSRARHGDHRRAAEEAADLATKAPPATALYNLACVLSLSAAGIARDPARPLPERDKLAEEYARQAVGLLRRAADAGHFRDPARRRHLEADADLAFLRPRDDFRALVRGLSPAAKP